MTFIGLHHLCGPRDCLHKPPKAGFVYPVTSSLLLVIKRVCIYIYIYVCACARVCVREKERESVCVCVRARAPCVYVCASVRVCAYECVFVVTIHHHN